jgi:cellulose synthase/poly-beta-1,6-N-acetylglucosamine synthase-like glycosyltransferase
MHSHAGLAADIAAAAAVPRGPQQPHRARGKLAPCPEIDCLRHLIHPATLAAAELRAIETGTGADRVLVAQGAISETHYAKALAFALGARCGSLARIPRTACPVKDSALIEAATTGILWIETGRGRFLVIAPRDMAARRLVNAVRSAPALAAHIWLTTPADLLDFVQRHAARAIADKAVDGLKAARPDFSASRVRSRPPLLPLAGILVAIAAYVAMPASAMIAVDVALALIFLGWTALRLAGALTTSLMWRRRKPIPDDALPVYSIIVALYREAPSVEGLVAAFDAFDYPREKLDITFVLEPDDEETRAAFARLPLGSPYTILTAPAAGPKTKPKALNAALPFARGEIVAVFDAEDRPEPDQLRRAVQAFRGGGDRLACVQARLTIDNAADNWLTRMFAAEYAGLFDVFLPGIAAWRLPLPLGGSSNHFRTSILRQAHGWDPYNVTEDADLGMRLARLGCHTAVIDSTTYEEAPARPVSWLKQRTRWFKGWMQTWLVHMRNPVRLWRDLGPAGFLVFQLVVGGTVLAALVHIVFAVAFGWHLASGWLWASKTGLADILATGLYATTLITGYVISALLALIGLMRRRMISCGWALLLMPVYWLLLSVAAWRALFQFIFRPYAWEKTEHGLALTSRLAARRKRKNG